MKRLSLGGAAMLLCSAAVLTQQPQPVTTIAGHVAKAERLEPNDSRARLDVPDGFEVTSFATGLGKPRVLAVAEDGTVYATRRDVGDVIMLRDRDRNHFQIFAVDIMLALEPGATAAAVLAALEGHVVGRGEIVGLYRAPQDSASRTGVSQPYGFVRSVGRSTS